MEMRTFEQYINSLATTPAYALKTREDFAFCGTNLIPPEMMVEYERFCQEWTNRFGVMTSIKNITQPGWYNITTGAAHGVYTTYPSRLRTDTSCWIESKVEQISRSWEKTFPGQGNNASITALIKIDPKFGPWISEVTDMMSNSDLQVVHYYNGNSRWVLKDNGGFSINLPGSAGSLPFQRSVCLIEANRKGYWTSTAIVLEWIFAAGYGNALMAANNALSGRGGESISTARRMIRAII